MDSYRQIRDAILQIQEGKVIRDVGCSTGGLLFSFLEKGDYQIQGLDYSVKPEHSYLPPDAYIHKDLTTPGSIPNLIPADIIICMEVAEHIEEEYRDNFLKSLVMLSKDNTLLVLGAAKPGQRGKGHVNCQEASYWEAALTRMGWCPRYDLREVYLEHTKDIPQKYYRDNVLIFKKEIYEVNNSDSV